MNDAVAGEARQAERILAERDQRDAAQHDGDAERDGDADEMRRVAHRRERQPFLRGAERRARPATAIEDGERSGTPAANSHAGSMPPSMTYSPCAKLTTPETLAVSTKPSATSA